MADINVNANVQRISTLGKVRILVEQVVGSPSQAQISQAVADYIDSHPGALSPLSAATKAALLQIAEKVAYVDENGQDYYDALDAALNAKALLSITAVYTQSGTVYDTDSLDSLKDDLVVTAYYDDGTTADVTSASTLSGTLAEGTSTVTVTYQEKTATFTVTVTGIPLLYNWDFTQSLEDTVSGVTAVLTNCERTEEGIIFDGATDRAVLGNVFGFNHTMEIDIADASASFGNVNGIWFWTDSGIKSGFGFRYNSAANSRGYAWYTQDAGHWFMSSQPKDYITGNATLKVTIDANGAAKAYVNGTQLSLIYNNAETWYSSESHASYITLGSPTTSYPCFYNAKITAVRIYEGVR